MTVCGGAYSTVSVHGCTVQCTFGDVFVYYSMYVEMKSSLDSTDVATNEY